MTLTQCGYDCGGGVYRPLHRDGGCGVWLTIDPERPPPSPWGHPLRPCPIGHIQRVNIPDRKYYEVAYCKVCARGFKTVHLGHGILMRPKDELDDLR